MRCRCDGCWPLVAATPRRRAAQPVETQAEALADDAVQYAAQFGVTPDEARPPTESTAGERRRRPTRSPAEFAGRLAGISIEHRPTIGSSSCSPASEPVADRNAAGVPIVFRTGAKATHAQAVEAMRKHLIDLRTDLPECARRRLRPAHRRGCAARDPRRCRALRRRPRSAPAPSRSAGSRSGSSSTSSTNPT